MKWWTAFVAFLLVCIFPGILFSSKSDQRSIGRFSQNATESAETFSQTICVMDQDTLLEMELDEYILGVILGEMPAEFELDALKAQAVASRTYTLRKVLKQNKHTDARVCTDASCCQAYIRTDYYLSHIGSESDVERVRLAVDETTGQVITYEGNLIEATYFSCSGGMTEDAAAVWGTSVPYLVAVQSPGEESSSFFQKQYRFSKKEFLRKLGIPETTELSESSIRMIATAGGGVDQMEISGMLFSGTQLRMLLGLPSTAFSVTIAADYVLISTRGYGHRVGMSQYGADAMAVEGSTYEQILLHYYPGTELVRLSSEQMKAIFDKAGNL